MADVQVTCIVKPNRESAHEHITHLGGQGWLWTREQVIRSIEDRSNSFYVLDPITRNKTYVGVVRPSDGRAPFVRTHADGVGNNNLLSLGECRI